MAPDFMQQMVDQGNHMLQDQGMQPYQPLQSPYFSNGFVQNHPALSGALGGALGVLGNMAPSPQGPTGAGYGIASVAQGIAGNAMMQRQFKMQQAMMPMEIAHNVAEYRKSMAPEAIKTEAGIVLRNPMNGHITPGLGMAQIAAGNNGAFDANGDYAKHLLGRYPDADEREQMQIKSAAASLSQIWDPQKRGEAELALDKDIADKRLSHQQFEATYQATKEQRKQTNIIARENADSKRMIAGVLAGRLDLAKGEFANRLYEPALGASLRYDTMRENVLHPSAQGDMSLLFNHIGMTMGAQSGAKMSEAEISRAALTRSLPDAALAEIQKLGIMPDDFYRMVGQDPSKLPAGGFLSPQQRDQMLSLAGTMRNLQWGKSRQSLAAAKLSPGYEPVDFADLDPVPYGAGAAPTTIISNPSAGVRVDGGGRGVHQPMAPNFGGQADPNDPLQLFHPSNH
jgi:hypothetical protein